MNASLWSHVLSLDALDSCAVNHRPASEFPRSMPTGSASPRPQRDSGVTPKSPASATGSRTKFATPPTVGVSGGAFEDELLAVMLSAAHRRFGAAARRPREASPGLLVFKEAWQTPAAMSPSIQVSSGVNAISPTKAAALTALQPESNQRTAALLAEIDSACSWSSSTSRC